MCVLDDLGQAAHPGRHHRSARPHRLDGHVPEGLDARRHDGDVGGGVGVPHRRSVAGEGHALGDTEAAGLLDEVALVPLVSAKGGAHQVELHVVSPGEQLGDRVDRQVLALVRAQSPHQHDARRPLAPCGIERRLGEGEPVVDDLSTRGEPAPVLLEVPRGRLGVGDDAVGQQRGRGQGSRDEPAIEVLQLVDVADRRDAGETGGHQPVGKRESADVDDVGPVPRHEAQEAGHVPGPPKREATDPGGREQGLAQHGEAEHQGGNPLPRDQLEQRAALRDAESHVEAATAHARHGAHQNAADPVQVGIGMRYEDLRQGRALCPAGRLIASATWPQPSSWERASTGRRWR